MISVGDDLGGVGFGPAQMAANNPAAYNNVSVVELASAPGVQIVDLGVDALYADFSVCAMNNWQAPGEQVVLTVGSNQTQLVVAGEEFYKKNPVAMQGKITGGGGVATEVKCSDRIEVNANCCGVQTGYIVHNVNRDSWGFITAFVDNYTATITVIDAGSGPPQDDDVIEFRGNNFYMNISRLHEGRGGTCSVTPGQYDRIIVDGLGFTGVPIVGDVVDISLYCSMNPFDKDHQPALVISPPPSYHGSGPDGRLQLKSNSEYRLWHIVRWKT